MAIKQIIINLTRPFVQYALIIFKVTRLIFQRFLELNRLYGLSGFIIALSGSSNVWQAEARVLGDMNNDQAMEFRKSVQDECSMIAVAVSDKDL